MAGVPIGGVTLDGGVCSSSIVCSDLLWIDGVLVTLVNIAICCGAIGGGLLGGGGGVGGLKRLEPSVGIT